MGETRMVWLFPGQGSQFVGMGRELCREFEPARRLLELASQLSGLPLETYCWQGPEELLARTDVLQPAVTAVSLGCLALLQERGWAPDAVAGHSLGQYAALCAAGVLTPEETLQLVAERGRLMHEAASRHPGGMLAVNGLTGDDAEAVVRGLAGRFRISVANYNAPSQTVLSGEHDGLAEAARKVAELGGQAVPLRVSGAWHSPLMEEARARFGEALRRVEFRPPHRRLWLDITGEPEADPQRIAEAMHAQLSAPVRWTAVLEGVRVGGAGMFVEVGPGKVLRGLLRRTWRAADFRTVGVDGPAALPFLSRQVGAEAAS